MALPQKSSQKILIVDDDLDTLKLVGTTLEKQGFLIIAAKDGVEALEKVAQHSPDLILLDIMMPRMDGYEVTRRLRANPSTENIPIILFTAKAQVDDKVTGLEAGANEYLTKPTHPAELVARVRALLKRPTSMLSPLPPEPGSSSQGVMVGVLGSKGGQGVSTMAINLAAAFLVEHKDETVVLAELRPGRSDATVLLGYKDPQGLNDLLKRNPQEIHRALVEKSLVVHKSGLRLLLSSNNPSDVNLLSATGQMASVVREINMIANYAVLDLGVGLQSSIVRALEQCTKVIVVVEPDPRTMQPSRGLLTELNTLGIGRDKLLVVTVLRVRTEQAMSIAEIQKALNVEIDAVFTPAPELAYLAARQHQPMLMTEPDSFTAQQTLKLANMATQAADE
jgi:DNA-binding response OmpR family regulator